MKLCIDIDGTICHLRGENESYADVQPLPGAVAKIQALKAAGHRIILLTARHMATCGSNVGLVIARQGGTLIDWLARHGIPYDELWFGKPHADVYIDDNAYRFTDWAAVDGSGRNLPISAERAAKFASKNLQIVIPMAGAGSRFAEAGYKLPKPLIPVLDRPMYSWAVDSLPLSKAYSLHFILLKDTPCVNRLVADIQARYARYNLHVHFVSQLTRGQTETVLLAEEYLDADKPLLIHNADTAFEHTDTTWSFLDSPDTDGALVVFNSSEKRWSYSREDSNGKVIEVREKVPISQHASTGTYYFRKTSFFTSAAKEQIASEAMEKQEFYVGPLYNILIRDNYLIKNTLCKRVLCFGTPVDLYESITILTQDAE